MCVIKGLAVGAGGVPVSSSQVARRPHRSSSPFPSASRASLRQISPCKRLRPAGIRSRSARIHADGARPCARHLDLVGAPPMPPMTPFQDAAAPKPPKYPADLESSLILPKQRASPASSLASLPYRRSNASLHKLFESTASISTSRPSSGSATPTASVRNARPSFAT